MTGWTSVNENIRVLTRNIRILLPQLPCSCPCLALLIHANLPAAAAVVQTVHPGSWGRGEPDLDKIVKNIF